MGPNGISVRVFASHPLAKAQFTAVIAAEPDLLLASGDERFQVGIFDGEMVALEAALVSARQPCPAMRAIVLARSWEQRDTVRLMPLGVAGAVAYESWQRELPAAVRLVAAGMHCFPALVQGPRSNVQGREGRTNGGLTEREAEVAMWVARRLSNKEVGGMLGISERTVKFHLKNVFGKLCVGSRRELETL